LIGLPRGAQRGYTKLFKKAKKNIALGKLDKAREQITELEAFQQRGLYEELYLQTLLVDFCRATGDAEKESAHLSRVMDFYDDGKEKDLQLVEPTFFLDYLARSYQLEVKDMELGEAFGSVDWMNEIDPDAELTRRVAAHAESVAAKVEGREFWMKGTLLQPLYGGDVGVWNPRLLRKEIELKEVVGRIDKIGLACEHGSRALPVQMKGRGWIIPDGWGKCDLWIYGEIGATVVIAELPTGTLAPGAGASLEVSASGE
jgi:hypothetical protein